MKKWMMLLIGALLISGCSTKTAAPAPTPETTPMPTVETTPEPTAESAAQPGNNPNPADMSRYSGFTETDNQFVEITMQQSLDMAAEGQSFIIYYGKPECPWCVEAIPVLNDAAREKDLLVYYVDTNQTGNYSEAMYDQLMTLFAGWLESDEEGEEHFYVPAVAVLIDGKVAANHIATVDTHDPYERKMTEEEAQQLKERYSEMMDKLAS